MSDATKRMNYFDRQFLRAADFEDEQAYNLDRRRRQNRFLHTPGVADGLTVKGNPGDSFVTVSAGTAYDSQGNDIVLASQQQVPLPSGVTGTVLIVIAYSEQSTNPSTDPGVTGNATRISEIPSLTATAPPAPPNSLPLAQVTLKNGTVDGSALNNPNNNVRTQAGCLLADNITVSSLTLKNATIPLSLWPTLNCAGANQAALTNGNLSLDAQREIFFADNGQIRCTDNNHRLVFNRAQNLLDLYEYGDIRFLTGPTVTEKMRVQASGNVGIGTVSPSTRLQVEGASDPLAAIAIRRSDNNKFMRLGVGSLGVALDFDSTSAFVLQKNTSGITGNFAGQNLVFVGGDGKVGIGTASPSHQLEVVDAGSTGLRVQTNTAGGTVASFGGSGDFQIDAPGVFGGRFIVKETGNTGIGTAAPAELLDVNGRVKSGALTTGPWPANPGGYVFFGTNALDQSKAGNYALLQGSGAETGVTFLNSPQQINFRIGNLDKMRLLKDGTIQWGNNSQLQPDQGGSIELGGNNALAGSGTPYIDFHFAGLVQDFNTRIINDASGQLTVNATNLVATGNALKPGGGGWTATCDIKLKKNIKPMKAVLDKLLKLRGVHFEWRNPEKHANLTGTQMGLIAQEVEEVFPEWVGVDSNGFKTVTLRGFEALMIEGLRELKVENDALKEKCKELEAKIQTPGKEPKSKA